MVFPTPVVATIEVFLKLASGVRRPPAPSIESPWCPAEKSLLVYRMSHPLAGQIIDACKAQQLPVSHLVFDYQTSPKKISILEPLLGQSGWLLATSLTVSSFEAEDHVLFALVTDHGTLLEPELSAEVGSRLFSLPAMAQPLQSAAFNHTLQTQLHTAIAAQRARLVNHTSERNGVFFDQELEKLDHWGEDRRSSLKINLKDLDDQIKELKKQARSAPNLPEKLKLEKVRKKCESERDQAWREYDQAAKEIEQAKDLAKRKKSSVGRRILMR